jgi:hypothetical protein
MKSSLLNRALVALAPLALASTGAACDLCGLYSNAIHVIPQDDYTWSLSIAEQFTHYGTIRVNGSEIGNPLDQHLDSSITQFVLGGSFLDQRLGLQVNVPYIYRSYARAGHFITEHGDEEGLGDLSLLASYVLFRTEDNDVTQPAPASGKGAKSVAPVVTESRYSGALSIKAGLKFPTGDSGRIEEETHEHEHEGFASSAVHGHDLALGSGSWDGIVGAEAYFRRDNLFFAANIQYSIRGEGDFDYRYANDLVWDFGPGVYFVRDDRHTVALQALVAGEHKGLDEFRGESAEDTGITFWFVGPRLTMSSGHWAAEAGVDLPVSLENTSLQSVPDYRIHASISYRF